MTLAIAAQGTLLRVDDGAGNFTTIAEVKDISGPELVSSFMDVTSHDSVDYTREFINSLRDPGEVTFSINYVPGNATHNMSAGLASLQQNRTLRSYQLVFPDAGTTTWEFDAYVSRFAPRAPVDGPLGADVTLRVTGTVTEA